MAIWGARKQPDLAKITSALILCLALTIIGSLTPYRFRYAQFAFVVVFSLASVGLSLLRQRYRFLTYCLVCACLLLEIFSSTEVLAARSEKAGISIRQWTKQFASLPEGEVLACDYASFIRYYAKRPTRTLCKQSDVDAFFATETTSPILLVSSALNYDATESLKHQLEGRYDFKAFPGQSHDSANGDGVVLRPYFDPIWLLLPRFNHQ